jgi:hypothetical protein
MTAVRHPTPCLWSRSSARRRRGRSWMGTGTVDRGTAAVDVEPQVNSTGASNSQCSSGTSHQPVQSERVLSLAFGCCHRHSTRRSLAWRQRQRCLHLSTAQRSRSSNDCITSIKRESVCSDTTDEKDCHTSHSLVAATNHCSACNTVDAGRRTNDRVPLSPHHHHTSTTVSVVGSGVHASPQRVQHSAPHTP